MLSAGLCCGVGVAAVVFHVFYSGWFFVVGYIAAALCFCVAWVCAAFGFSVSCLLFGIAGYFFALMELAVSWVLAGQFPCCC